VRVVIRLYCCRWCCTVPASDSCACSRRTTHCHSRTAHVCVLAAGHARGWCPKPRLLCCLSAKRRCAVHGERRLQHQRLSV
jgi:hypothetical protein